jgi:hypothetical protein
MKNLFFALILLFSCGVQKNSHQEKVEIVDASLISFLEEIYDKDQTMRIELDTIRAEHGNNSEAEKNHWKKIQLQDSLNFKAVDSIVSKYGWLGVDLIGKKANSALFLVIQHSKPQHQNNYILILKKAFEEGKINPYDYALFYDRVTLRETEKQLYGSQVGMNHLTEKFFLFPISNVQKIDSLRGTVGLDSIKFYLSSFDIEWNPEQYEKELPELIEYLNSRKK